MHRPGSEQTNSQNTPAPAYPFGKGAYSKEHLDYTIKKFQPYYKTTLKYEDAAEIVYNTLHFVKVVKQGNTPEKTGKKA
jgi:hypothetical protein